MFTTLNSLDDMEEKVDTDKISFFFITQTNCSVCQGLFPQIEVIMRLFPDIQCYTANATEIPAIAGSFEVFTAPTLLLFVEGKEYIREARFVQTEKFREKVAQIYENVIEP